MDTNQRGEILCDVCHADGQPCDICGSRGVLTCFAMDCERPATIYGTNPSLAYCSIRCAFDDDEWPACIHCGAEPQDAMYAPYCCSGCEDAVLGAIHKRKLDRWRADLAAQVGE